MNRLLGALCLAFALAVTVRAGEDFTIASLDPNLTLSVRTCFTALGEYGYAPVVVTIENQSGNDLAWDFDFLDGSRYSSFGQKMHREVRLAVPAGTRRQYPLLLPLTSVPSTNLSVIVNGPGMAPGNEVHFRSGIQARELPAMAMSRSVGLPLQELLGEKSSDRDGSGSKRSRTRVNYGLYDLADLPTDWRGYTCLQAVFIGARELATLSAEQRAALVPWVQSGGRLIICEAAEVPADFQTAGFGQVQAVAGKLEVHQVDALAAELSSRKRFTEQAVTQSWGLLKEVGTTAPNIALIAAFLVAFGVLIGPVNLYVLAPEARRARLFFTTPAIAVGASAVLAVGIILKDGFGGQGYRQAVVHVSPEHKQAVTLQAQISRTGVLWRSSFRLAEPAVVQPLELTSGRTVTEFTNDTVNLSGDWFAARSVQGQLVESVVPTRGEVRLAAPSAPGAPPAVISTIEPALKNFFYRDEQAKVWAVAEVPPGRPTQLSPSPNDVLQLPDATEKLSKAWREIRPRTGYFFAEIARFPGILETLPSVHWRDQSILICGPVTAAK